MVGGGQDQRSLDLSTGGARGIPAAAVKTTTKKLPCVFIQKLHAIVNTSDDGSVVGWSATGDSFVVGDTAKFARDVLPNYFKTNNFASFLRQLHFYGFRKTDRSKNAWEFGHRDFIKDEPERMNKIHRKNSESSSSSSAAAAVSQQKLQVETAALGSRVSALEQKLEAVMAQMHRYEQRMSAQRPSVVVPTDHPDHSCT